MSESKTGILYLIDVLAERGGTELNLQRLVTNLDHSRYYSLVCPLEPNDSTMIRQLREENIDVVPLDLPSIFSFRALKCAFLVRKLIKRRGIRIVQTIHFGSDIFGALCKALWGWPQIISSRRDMGFNETRWQHRFLRRCTKCFLDRVLTNSVTMRDHIAAQEIVPAPKLSVIYNGVEIPGLTTNDEKESLRAQLGIQNGAFVIGCVANIQPIKGFEYLIRAISDLAEKVVELQVILVGGIEMSDKNLENYFLKLRSMISANHLDGKIHFLGSRRDVPALVSIMDIFVLPSLSEGFSNAIIEAMAAGVAVVATTVGGNGEAVMEGGTGLLVPPADPEALVRALTRLYQDKALRKRMGEAARKRAAENFSISQMVRSMEDLYASHAGTSRYLVGEKATADCEKLESTTA
jgi:L-malate glycosyltransferase